MHLFSSAERNCMEQGRKVTDHVTPLARNFSCVGKDVESGNIPLGEETGETKPNHSGNVAHGYSPLGEQRSIPEPVEQVQKGISSTPIKPDTGNSEEAPSVSSAAPDSPAATDSSWASVKTGLQSFRARMSSKFLPLSKSPSLGTSASATESLDEIFRRLKRHPSNADADHLDDDELP